MVARNDSESEGMPALQVVKEHRQRVMCRTKDPPKPEARRWRKLLSPKCSAYYT